MFCKSHWPKQYLWPNPLKFEWEKPTLREKYKKNIKWCHQNNEPTTATIAIIPGDKSMKEKEKLMGTVQVSSKKLSHNHPEILSVKFLNKFRKIWRDDFSKNEVCQSRIEKYRYPLLHLYFCPFRMAAESLVQQQYFHY